MSKERLVKSAPGRLETTSPIPDVVVGKESTSRLTPNISRQLFESAPPFFMQLGDNQSVEVPNPAPLPTHLNVEQLHHQQAVATGSVNDQIWQEGEGVPQLAQNVEMSNPTSTENLNAQQEQQGAQNTTSLSIEGQDVEQQQTEQTISIPILLLPIIGGVIIGYALSFPGGLPRMQNFLRQFSRSILIGKLKAKATNFCSYTNHRLLLFVTTIPMSSFLSIWIALLLSSIWGRKPILMVGSICWTIGSCLCTWYPTNTVLFIGMVLQGLGLGITYQIIPMICSETVSIAWKKRIDIIFQFMILIGNMFAFLVSFISSYYLKWGWRLSFGVVILLSLLLVFLTWLVEETPMTVRKNQSKNQFKDLISYRSRPKLLINMFNQFLSPLIGTSSLIFFGPLLLESLGYDSHQSFLGPLLASVCGILSSGILCIFHDRFGRRIPIIASTILMFIAMVIIGIIFKVVDNVVHLIHLKTTAAAWIIVFVTLSVVCFFVITSPNGWIDDAYYRESSALGAAVEVSISMAMIVVMGHITLPLFCALTIWVFIFMGSVAVVTGLFVFYFVPETTGIPSDEISTIIWSKHCYWKKFLPNGESSYA